jgi:L-fuconate dehydratase
MRRAEQLTIREHARRFIEEPVAPDDILGHLFIRQSLLTPSTPSGPTIRVASGEHAHSRILFKQLLKSRAIDVCQIDSCRLAGVSEVLSVLLMSAKEGVLVCPHAGGVGLCEMVVHLR